MKIIHRIGYRFFKRYNIVKIHSLPNGYYDKDTILLHSIMQLIVDYVEIELSELSREDKCEKILRRLLNKLPWIIRPEYRSRVDGIAYLDFAIKKLEKDDLWVEAYKNIKEVYIWWKDIYPTRKRPEDVFNYAAFIKSEKKFSRTYAHKKHKKIIESMNKLEQKYKNEEKQMMNTVIKYSDFLWT